MDAIEIRSLNERYAPLSPLDRIQAFYHDFTKKRILVTSSFGSTSSALLHLISETNPAQKIHFINTGFHFQETLTFKEECAHFFGLDVVDIHPDQHHNRFSRNQELWKKDPDLCCGVNKISPFEAFKANADFWVTGLIGNQSEHRKNLRIFELEGKLVKFNPIIDFTTDAVFDYIAKNGLPKNKLIQKGYFSIGCKHCTSKGKNREGRWQGKSKTECGLHVPNTPQQSYENPVQNRTLFN